MGRKNLSKLWILILVSMVFLLTGCGTALHSAAKSGNLDKTNMLIAQGADVNATDQDGRTPLQVAAKFGRNSTIKALIDAKADLEFKTDCMCFFNKSTALHYASVYGHTETAKLLLDAGADENSINSSGRTYIGVARRFKKHEFVNYFENQYKIDRRARLEKERIDADNKAFALASTTGTIEAFSQYLGDPKCERRTEALAGLANLLNTNQNSGKINDYLKTYPELTQHLPLKYCRSFIGPDGLTVADLIKFKKQGVDDAIAEVKVKASSAKYKDFNLQEIEELKSAGLSIAVISAMISSNASAIAEERRQAEIKVQAKLAAKQAAQAAKKKASAGSACVAKRLAAVMACDQVPGGFIPQLACKAIVKKKFACN